MSVSREGDNVILEGLVDHGVYPVRHEEIDHTVILRGEYDVRGAIYGRRLHALGSGAVHGPVVTREDIVLDERNLQHHVFLSGLTSPSVIRNDVPAYAIQESCVVDLANARLQVRGPILADTVHLSNAVILGNIHAREATLNACVVFGIIECDELLVLNTCNFVAFRAGRARLKGRLTTWLGYGIAFDGTEFLKAETPRPHLELGQDGYGTQVPADVRFLPICLSGTACAQLDDFETCNLYHDGTCPSCVSGLGHVPPNSPKISLLDLDFQLHVVPRPQRDVQVDVQYLADGVDRQETLRLSGIVQLIARGVPEGDIRVRTGHRSWVPCRQHDDFADFDPEVWVRYRQDQRPRQERTRLSRVASLLGEGIEASSSELSTDELSWASFYEHPAFQNRYAISRVLSVTGRLLDGRAIRQALFETRDLAHRIAHYPYLDPASQTIVERERPRCHSTQHLFDLGIAKADIRQQGPA